MAEYVIPGSIIVFLIGAVITVKIALAGKISYKEAYNDYVNKPMCAQTQKNNDEIHKNIKEKLECIPEIRDAVAKIETKIDMFLKLNNKNNK